MVRTSTHRVRPDAKSSLIPGDGTYQAWQQKRRSLAMADGQFAGSILEPRVRAEMRHEGKVDADRVIQRRGPVCRLRALG